VSDSTPESQVRDEPSRKELQRLEPILSGGMLRFLRLNLLFIFVPFLLPMPLALYRWLLFSNLRYVIPVVLVVVAGTAIRLFYVWRLYESRAAAIRAGASFAAPVNLKDHYIFLLTALFLGLFSGMLSDDTLISPSELTRIGRLFLFIASVVFALWSLGKAVVGYRVCPTGHLRRRDLSGAIFSSIFLLFFLSFGAMWVTSLSAVVELYVARTAPNYLVPAKP
jgi:hypothetical protein